MCFNNWIFIDIDWNYIQLYIIVYNFDNINTIQMKLNFKKTCLPLQHWSESFKWLNCQICNQI